LPSPLHVSLPPLPARALAQAGQVGKLIRLNTAKKEKHVFFSGRSVPQPGMDKSQNMLVAWWSEGGWEKEEQWQRVVGLPRWLCLASGAFSAQRHSVFIPELLFIASHATTHFQV